MSRTATEASLDVGFNNYNHFASLFRKMYGVSPRNFLRKP
jgi:AraC family transcriptional regulator of arabinose operon